MAGDPMERAKAGRLWDLQPWLGGSDHSPFGAMYVPPPPLEFVPGYLGRIPGVGPDWWAFPLVGGWSSVRFRQAAPETLGSWTGSGSQASREVAWLQNDQVRVVGPGYRGQAEGSVEGHERPSMGSSQCE